MFANDADVPWTAILTTAGIVIGASLSKVSDLVSVWFKGKTDAKVAVIKAEAEAKAHEATVRDASEDAAYKRLGEYTDRLARDLMSMKEQSARQDSYIDQLTDELSDTWQEQAQCQAENRDWREYWDRQRPKIEAGGIPLDHPPRSQPDDPEAKKEREFRRRQLRQSGKALKAVGQDLLAVSQPTRPLPPSDAVTADRDGRMG